MRKGKIISFTRRERKKMAVKPIKATTEVSDEKIIKEIRMSLSKRPTKQSRDVNNAAKLLVEKMLRERK